tara:strand:- start:340 stop:837 length:498 start_codon:yes stop_codon:yes gene_type:complete
MSGKEELSIEKLEKFIEDLESYTNAEGVINIEHNPEVEGIINLSSFELKSLTAEECCEKAFVVQGYCNYLQKIYNKHLARFKWCEELINHTVASRANNFDKYTKWEVKVNSIIREDEFIQKVWRVKRIAEGRITILTDTVRDVRRQADTLLELGRRRRNEPYRHN